MEFGAGLNGLHLETHGDGQPLLLIHGWGLHGGMWSGIASRLASANRVLMIDLPGHGLSRNEPLHFDLDSLTDAVAEGLPEDSTVLGWSLGGIVALQAANRYPHRIARLILLSTTPRFVSGEDWPCAIDPAIVDQFSKELTQDYTRTIKRFLTLQVRGDEHATRLLASLRKQVFERGDPDPAALSCGLEILRSADLRSALSGIVQPTLVISGERDTLVPPEASRRMATHMSGASYASIPGASHAPFLSHQSQFLDLVRTFLEDAGTEDKGNAA